ncbi:interleukin-33 [Orycteropus afer afer]|uniref:Interleukin-33 n=1 Tax=Orycteropus afer afer TaxID=1230840 RepID=A0AC54ZCL4_ORYAF|nr:interleukin-33 [Orycteropus afer afer]
MKLCSGCIIENSCYLREETTKVMSPKIGNKHKKQHLVFSPCQELPVKPRQFIQRSTAVLKVTEEQKYPSIQGTSPVTEHHASLSTFNDQFITFVFENGAYAIYVEYLGKDQQKDKVLLRYYASQTPAGESGDEVDGKKFMVNLSPTKDKNFCLHADNNKLSVDVREILEPKKPLPEQAFFLLHRQTSDYVSFECKSNPGTFIGVSDNHLKLIQVKDHGEETISEKIMFKLYST